MRPIINWQVQQGSIALQGLLLSSRMTFGQGSEISNPSAKPSNSQQASRIFSRVLNFQACCCRLPVNTIS